MKKYWLKFIALLLAVLLPFAAYFVYVQAQPPQFGASIMGTASYKIDLLESTPGNRIILVGGSSSPYATDCAKISDAFDMTCINIGITAYLGIDFYTSMLEHYTRPGDIIVIAPEHSILSGAVDYKTVWATIENHTQLWDIVPLGYWPSMVTQYYQYAQNKLDLLKENNATQNYPNGFGVLGDVTAYREPLLESGYVRDDLIDLGPNTLNETVVKSLNSFYKFAQSANAAVFFAFAPVNAMAVISTPEEWNALEELLQNELNIPVLGHLNDTVMAGHYFYDSNNHLTTAGAQIYTNSLIELLTPVIT